MPHKGAVIAILGLLIVTGRDHLAGATAIEVMNRDCAVSQLETTMRRSMALLADGTLWQWGMVPLDTEHWKPIPVVGIERVRAFSMAVDCTHVLLEDGTVWGWGANQYSCVGAGMSPLITELVQLDLPEPVESLEGGTSHVLGVCASGAVVGWGSNLEWQLGFPLQLEVSTPTVIPGLSSIVAVSAGKGHSLALAADGSVFAFGNNSDGRIGIPPTAPYHEPVTRVPGLPPAVAVSAGETTSFAVTGSGELWAWGSSTEGALGLGDSVTSTYSPTLIPGLGKVIDISATRRTTLALLEDGTLMAWGYNFNHDLCATGVADEYIAWSPIPAFFPGAVVQLSAAIGITATILADGTIWSCGSNYYGDVGDGTNRSRATPTRTLLDPDVVPPDQGNVLFALRSGVDVRLDFGGAAASAWRVFRDTDKAALGVTSLTPDPATREYIDRGTIGVAGTDFYRVKGLSLCSSTPGI